MQYCVPNVDYFDLQMSIAKYRIFSWVQSNMNLETKEKLNFNAFLWQMTFKIF